jgi:hypothetical protein
VHFHNAYYLYAENAKTIHKAALDKSGAACYNVNNRLITILPQQAGRSKIFKTIEPY